MKLHTLIIAFFLTLSLDCFSQQAGSTTAIRLGKPAPPLKISYWLKGNPLKKFEKGQVYVLEFWATWCGYCIKAMPHLSELNTHYAGKVRFIGVDVMEFTPWQKDPIEYNRQKIDEFVNKGAGKTMNYDVCRDTKDGFMDKKWVTAQSLYSRNHGIPFTVIVDKAGNVAWLGNPADTAFDRSLAQIVDGSYDVNAFIVKCKQQLIEENNYWAERDTKRNEAMADPLLNGMKKVIAEKDYQMAIQEAYAAIAQKSALYGPTYLMRLQAFSEMVRKDANMSVGLLKELETEQIRLRKDTTYMFIRDVASAYAVMDSLPASTYTYAISVLKDTYTDRVTVYRHLRGLARAYYLTGNHEMAVKVTKRMADQSREMGQDPTEYEALMEKYK